MNLSARQETGTGFLVSEIAPATAAISRFKLNIALKKKTHGPIEGRGDDQCDVVPAKYHALFATASPAFQEHRPQVLSPDTVWLALAQGVATHIALNAEALRQLVR